MQAKEREESSPYKNIGNLPSISINDFKVESLIGKGGYGNVYRGIWEGVDVAIKQLHMETLAHDLLQEFLNEAKIMQSCRHPNIVQFFAVCVQQGKDSLIMEYLPNGSLFNLLNDSRFPNIFLIFLRHLESISNGIEDGASL